MEESESSQLELARNQLQEVAKPFQQEQAQRQKKSDFLKQCIRGVEKSNFFQLDELLRSALAKNVLEDAHFTECDAIFGELRKFADRKIEQYRIEFNGDLLRLAEEAELPLELDYPRFTVLKGIEGTVDFVNRCTVINQIKIKSVDPKRIISKVIQIKRKLYDTPFDPKQFIDTLFHCYKKILDRSGEAEGNIVSVRELYQEYVWSLQSKAFFQNMDKGKFKGCSADQFAVYFWRFFCSNVSSTEGGYCVRLNSGRGKSLWLIDQTGERRQITSASFVKS